MLRAFHADLTIFEAGLSSQFVSELVLGQPQLAVASWITALALYSKYLFSWPNFVSPDLPLVLLSFLNFTTAFGE